MEDKTEYGEPHSVLEWIKWAERWGPPLEANNYPMGSMFNTWNTVHRDERVVKAKARDSE